MKLKPEGSRRSCAAKIIRKNSSGRSFFHSCPVSGKNCLNNFYSFKNKKGAGDSGSLIFKILQAY